MTIDATPIVGLRIRLRRTIDTPCAACGHPIVVISQGAGPHAAGLHCVGCDRHRGWLPRAVTEFLLTTVARFGRPREGITIRNSEFAPMPGAHLLPGATGSHAEGGVENWTMDHE